MRRDATVWPRVMAALVSAACDRGWTRKRLAEEVFGASPQTVTKWCETDGSWRREPPVGAVRQLQVILGVAVVILPDSVLILPLEDVPDVPGP